jgi:hypothetical protein
MRVLATVIALCVFIPCAGAQSDDPRCDFTDCGPGNPIPANIPHATPDAPGAPPCGVDDREECKAQCRSTFGPEYHTCVSDCLAEICSDQTKAPKSHDEQLCLEDNSDDCADECKQLSTTSAPRCRRACLSKLCPNAPAGDLTDEASSPGKLHCKRCRTEVQRDCARNCAIGTAGVGKSAGLAGLGCEKMCVMARCGDNCVGLSPF